MKRIFVLEIYDIFFSEGQKDMDLYYCHIIQTVVLEALMWMIYMNSRTKI